MRVTIRVVPGSSHPAVGGSHDGALVVRVRERAIEGHATRAALKAVAAALDVRPGAVALVRGTTSRTKVIDVCADAETVSAAVNALLDRR